MKQFIIIIYSSIILSIFNPFQLVSSDWNEAFYLPSTIVITAHCVDSLNCYMLVEDSPNTIIFKTHNQGKTWEKIFEIDESIGPSPTLYGIKDAHAPDTNYYYIAVYEYSHIRKSIDGGRNFETIRISDEDERFRDITMLDSINGILTKYGFSHFYLTNDGFKTTKKINNPHKSWLYSTVYMNNNTINMLSSNENENKFLKYYIDKDNWYNYNFPSEEYLSSLYMVDSLVGFISGSKPNGIGNQSYDIIYKTTNAGQSWVKQIEQEVDPIFGIQDISFKDRFNGVAVGQFGKILLTNDGGNTWIYDELPEKMKIMIPPRMRVVWAGSVPLIGTFSGSFYRYEGDYFVFNQKDTLSIENNHNKDINIIRQENKVLISIEDSKFNSYEFRIINTLGMEILQYTIPSGMGLFYRTYDISSLTRGAYFYQITNKNKTIQTGKFFVE